jgi:hypothetical protein
MEKLGIDLRMVRGVIKGREARASATFAMIGWLQR